MTPAHVLRLEARITGLDVPYLLIPVMNRMVRQFKQDVQDITGFEVLVTHVVEEQS